MKKLMILLAVACLIFVSCGTKKQQEVVQEEPKCEFAMMLEKWDTFAELDAEGQIALVAEAKAFLDEQFAKCDEKCKEEVAENEEVCPIKAKWEVFETLALDEQAELINTIIAHMKECCKEKESCCKEKTDGCAETCEKKCGKE